MPATNKCAYNGCKHVPQTSPDLSFHRFPNNEEVLRKWIILVGRDEWLNVEAWKLENQRICSTHFQPNDFENFDRKLNKRKLKSNALPAINKSSTHSVDINKFVPPTVQFALFISVSEASGIPETEISLQRDPAVNAEKRPQISRREQLLMKKNATLTARLKKARQTICNLTRKSIKKLSIPEVISGAANYLDGNRLLLMKMQLNHLKVSPWSEDEKQFSLRLFYKSPKAYEFLRSCKIIALPCVSLIRKWANEIK